MLKRKAYKPRKNTGLNPKVGKLVVNRQRTTYGILKPSGKIVYWLTAKESYFNQAYNQYRYATNPPIGVRIGNLRVM